MKRELDSLQEVLWLDGVIATRVDGAMDDHARQLVSKLAQADSYVFDLAHDDFFQ